MDIYDLLKDEFIRFIDQVKTGPVDDYENRTIKVPSEINGKSFWGFDNQKRYVYGIIESGLYGKQLQIADKDNPRNILFSSSNNNVALMKPFFFLIFIPRIGDTAFVILERTDNEGIYPLFHTLFASFLHNKRPINGKEYDYTIRPQNYLSHAYVDNLKNGTIKSVKLSLSKIPDDLADAYMLHDLDVDTSISITLNFKGGLRPGHSVSRAIKDNRTIFSSEAFTNLFSESQRSIVTESIMNGVQKERTVYLSQENENHIRPYYVIDVIPNERGYSDFDSILSAVYSFIDSNPDLVSLLNQRDKDEQ
ncbi:MAG: hypothetical protein K5669_06215 [Lachnospiraceae bacterium]|nr:hypothetical protein [Lachnospiraceae bacterium]